MDKTIAREYFRQFGKLKRLLFKPLVRICTAEYLTREDFLKALNNAGDYKGSVFDVFVEKSTETKKKETAKSSKHIWVDDKEVEAELKAMSGVGDITEHDVSLRLVHQEKRKKTKVRNVVASVKKKQATKENIQVVAKR